MKSLCQPWPCGLILLASYAAVTAIYTVLWLAWTPAPSGWLWLATTIMIAGCQLAFCGISLWRLLWGPQRWMVAGWWMLASAPTVWIACLSGDAFATAYARGNLELTTPVRIIAVWICGGAEVEAWWRYPRRLQGVHVELVDDGTTPAPERLLATMDQHVQRLSRVVGHDPPAGHIELVRGSLLGFSGGRNIVRLAICDTDNDGPDYLDYHETAHAVLSCLAGPHQYPPMFLAEGWAQQFSSASQSNERDHAIRTLAQMRRQGSSISFAELASQDNYGRSRPEAYSHGSAMVAYLLERFGGPLFFRLYGEARPDSFPGDVERILGVPWDRLQTDFWQWLEEQAQQLPPPPASAEGEFNFHPGVDAQLWHEFLVEARAHQVMLDSLPDQFAIQWSHLSQGQLQEQIRLLRIGQESWLTVSGSLPRWEYLGPEQCVSLIRTPDGRIENTVATHETRPAVSNTLNQTMTAALLAAQLQNQVPAARQGLLFPDGLDVLRLTAPSEESPVWETIVVVKNRFGDITYELTLSEMDFQVERTEYVYGDQSGGTQIEFGQLLGRRLPIKCESLDDTRTTLTSELSAEQSNELRREVEQMIARGADAPPVSRHWLPAPKTWPVIWIGCAFVLLLCHAFGGRLTNRLHSAGSAQSS